MERGEREETQMDGRRWDEQVTKERQKGEKRLHMGRVGPVYNYKLVNERYEERRSESGKWERKKKNDEMRTKMR